MSNGTPSPLPPPLTCSRNLPHPLVLQQALRLGFLFEVSVQRQYKVCLCDHARSQGCHVPHAPHPAVSAKLRAR